jgi:hypothetical protein
MLVKSVGAGRQAAAPVASPTALRVETEED